MTRWAVIFEDTPDMMDIRADPARRDAHVAYARAHPKLLIGGGLRPGPEAAFCGALWIVEAGTRDEVVRLIENDPFYEPRHRRFEIFTWGKIVEDVDVTL